MSIRALFVFGSLVLIAAGGCEHPTGVQGSVTLNGQPIKKGAIAFRPTDGMGPSAGGMIENGEYTVEKITPGEKLVLISAINQGKVIKSREEAMKMIEEAKKQGKQLEEALRADLIPANAKGNSQTVQIAEGSQTLDFEVSTN